MTTCASHETHLSTTLSSSLRLKYGCNWFTQLEVGQSCRMQWWILESMGSTAHCLICFAVTRWSCKWDITSLTSPSSGIWMSDGLSGIAVCSMHQRFPSWILGDTGFHSRMLPMWVPIVGCKQPPSLASAWIVQIRISDVGGVDGKCMLAMYWWILLWFLWQLLSSPLESTSTVLVGRMLVLGLLRQTPAICPVLPHEWYFPLMNRQLETRCRPPHLWEWWRS